MKISFSPLRADYKIQYTFENETIAVTINGITDTFDFSTFPDGQADTKEIDTILPINPIFCAERKNGTLYIILRNFIDEKATYEERFPQWQEVIPDGNNTMEN